MSEIEENALLVTSPPKVSLTDARRVAGVCYPGFVKCTPLTGERDVNFRISHPDGRSLTLKFINAAEALDETDMQISVLKHLQHMSGVSAPLHQPADASILNDVGAIQPGNDGSERTLDWVLYQPENGASVRVRAYSYLHGSPGAHLAATPLAWSELGNTIAVLGKHLAGFDHPAAHRQLLWDTCQVLGVRPMLTALEDAAEREMIEDFLEIFASRVAPALSAMPHQVIHNDLSPSNLLVDDGGAKPTGILDFGDMVYAPRIAEIAVAASYQMGGSKLPLDVLDALINGYERSCPLTHAERAHVVDLVLARLVQRMVITAWRARRFPANRTYILRSHDAAKALFEQLYDGWRLGVATRGSAPGLTPINGSGPNYLVQE